MLLTLYPNREIRARFPSAVADHQRSDRPALKLVNRDKLATNEIEFLSCPLDAELWQRLNSTEDRRYPSCPWPRRGYGGTPEPIGFSVRARKTMSRAGGVFAPADSNRLCFLTGTLPGSTEAAIKAMSDYSAWFVHELMQKIPRCLGVPARELRWMWCYEWQERGALHWHAVFEAPTEAAAQDLMSGFRDIWISTLRGLQRKAGVDVAEKAYGGTHWDDESVMRVDAQIGREAPQNYLASYLSKDDSKGGTVLGPYPSRWYSCSRRILSELREQIVTVSTHLKGRDWQIRRCDLGLIERVLAMCGYSVAFADKVGTGSTVVGYLREDQVEKFKVEIIGNFARTSELSERWFRKSNSVTEGKEAGFMRYQCVDWCGRYARVREALYAEVGDYYRHQLESYVNGLEYNAKDLEWLNWYAQRLLQKHGIIRSVTPPQRSGAGLTGDHQRKLETSEGPFQLGLPLPEIL